MALLQLLVPSQVGRVFTEGFSTMEQKSNSGEERETILNFGANKNRFNHHLDGPKRQNRVG